MTQAKPTVCMTEAAKTRGRPIDIEATHALKSTAAQLVHEFGYEGTSIAAICKSAGIPRQTLYNRWISKAELVFEAVVEENILPALEPTLDKESCHQAQLEDFLTNLFTRFDANANTLCALITTAQRDMTFQAVFHTKLVNPLEKPLVALLRRAQGYGDLFSGRDPEMLSSFILGDCWYRLLNGRSLDANHARKISKEIFS